MAKTGRPTVRKRQLTDDELDWEIKKREEERAKRRAYREKNRDKIREQKRKYKQNHPEQAKKWRHDSYERNKEHHLEVTKEAMRRLCKDPVTGDIVKYGCLVKRIKNHADVYGNIRPCDYYID